MSNGTDNPFIERPEEHEVGAANELYCWMPGNADRECDGSCVAFSAGEGNPCSALEALLELGVSVRLLVNLRKQSAVQGRVAAQKAAIEQIPQPPEVK